MGKQQGPLGGVLVADFSRVLAGPLATMILGDLGAEVVKIERPANGDETREWGPPYGPGGEASYYLAINRNKRSVTLDLTDDHDRRLARRLVERADVVVENYRPGTMERFGLGYDDVSAVNPGVVYATVSGFGSAAGATLAGYDFLVQAMSGFLSITGEPEGSPIKTGVAIVDVMAALHTVIGVLAALREREASGRGQEVEVSLMGAALAGLVNQASAFLTAGVVPGRLGNRHPSIVPYELFETATTPLALAVGNDRQFGVLCEELGIPTAAADDRWSTNAARVRNRDELAATLTERFATAGRDQWIERLRSRGIPCGPVNDVAEAFATAKGLGIEAVAGIAHPNGYEVATVTNPVGLSRTPVSYRLAPPRLGEHDADVRADLDDAGR